jgi:hypothetical protein
MTTQKQIDANRRNAQKSTGPKTPEGKEIASQNATRHGLLAQALVLEGESREEFDRFSEGLMAHLGPVGYVEMMLAERVVAGAWRSRRALRIEWRLVWQDQHLLITRLGSVAVDEDPDEIAKPASMMAERMLRDDTYEKFRRYESSIERGFYRALHELQRLQAARKGEDVAAPVAVDVDVEASASREALLTAEIARRSQRN